MTMAARKRGEGKTPHRTIRVDHDPWLPFGANCERAGTDRSHALVEFIRWFNREPGAKLPKRPDSALSDEEYAAAMKMAPAPED
ncbi:hypothetical protein K1W54_04355 [Micromonospora sp. CPCC 205371]|nr:hypothetical protein [Micromonospora sp. CPCC 205371]